MGKCSADTALRDINDLLERGVQRKLAGGVRGICWSNRLSPSWHVCAMLLIIEQLL